MQSPYFLRRGFPPSETAALEAKNCPFILLHFHLEQNEMFCVTCFSNPKFKDFHSGKILNFGVGLLVERESQLEKTRFREFDVFHFFNPPPPPHPHHHHPHPKLTSLDRIYDLASQLFRKIAVFTNKFFMCNIKSNNVFKLFYTLSLYDNRFS